MNNNLDYRHFIYKITSENHPNSYIGYTGNVRTKFNFHKKSKLSPAREIIDAGKSTFQILEVVFSPQMITARKITQRYIDDTAESINIRRVFLDRPTKKQKN